MTSLPSYLEIKSSFPIPLRAQTFIQKSREKIRNILRGEESQILLIVGPCSIHEPASAIEFALRLRDLSYSLSSNFFFVMRVYCEKPRTLVGWNGFLYDPHLNGSNDVQTGIILTRQLLIELASLEIPTATEFLHPCTAFYYDDLISWGCIGARTSSSPVHRQLASSLSMPIGFKNGVAGDISAAVYGAAAAMHPQTYIRLSDDHKELSVCETLGNRDTHVILRGGESGPNFDAASIAHVCKSLREKELPQRLLIDCSHQNSEKNPYRQTAVFQSVLSQITDGHHAIRGMLFESHLREGNQPLDNPASLQYGVSITDACLDWNATADLFHWGKDYIDRSKSELCCFLP